MTDVRDAADKSMDAVNALRDAADATLAAFRELGDAAIDRVAALEAELAARRPLTWHAAGIASAQWPPFGGPVWSTRDDWFLEPLPWTYGTRTESADDYLNRLGVVVAGVPSDYRPQFAQLAFEMGFRHARVEFTAGEATAFSGETVTFNPDALDRWRDVLTALKGAGLRPLILLNSHSSQPPPWPAYGPHDDTRLEQQAADGYTAYAVAVATFAADVVGSDGFDLELLNEPGGRGSDHYAYPGAKGANWESDARYFTDPQTGYTYGKGRGPDRYVGGDDKGPLEALVSRMAYAVRTALPDFGGQIHNGAGNKLPWQTADNRAWGTDSYGVHGYAGLGDPQWREQGRAGWPEAQFWATSEAHLTRRVHPTRQERTGQSPALHGKSVVTPAGRWGAGERMQFWMTETGYVAGHDSEPGEWERRAKGTLRLVSYYPAKGVDRLYLYSLASNDRHRLIDPDAITAALERSGGIVNDDVRQAAGPVYAALAERAKLLTADGNDTTPPPTVTALVAGTTPIALNPDGSPRGPADELFVAVYRLADGDLAIKHYVVTRDVTQPSPEWPVMFVVDGHVVQAMTSDTPRLTRVEALQ